MNPGIARLFVWEVRKLLGGAAARAGLVVVVGFLVLAMIGFASAPGDASKKTVLQREAAGELPIPGIYLKGLGFAKHMLDPVSGLVVPVILCVVLAGSVAGEAESGTLSEILSRPVARWKLVAAKLAAGMVFLALVMAVAAAVAIPLSSLVLGQGRLFTKIAVERVSDPGTGVTRSEIAPQYFTGWRAFSRVLAAWAVAAAALAPVAALAVLASSAARRARTAAVTSAGIYLGLYSLGRTPALGSFRRYALAGRVDVWQVFLGPEIAWGAFLSGAAVLAVTFAILSAGAALVLGGRELAPRD